MLHRVILTAASVFALTAAANAADMYRPAEGGYKDVPYVGVNWGGLYVGVNGGYGWAADSNLLANTTHTAFSGLAPSGGFAGGQIGYNFKVNPHIVAGIEADFQGADISETHNNTLEHYSSKIDWFGTVRGRLGYTVDRALVYATGGLAYGHVNNFSDDIPVNTYTNTVTATGYVVGGGVEYKVAPAWSVKAEYQYINLGSNQPVDASGKTWNQWHTGTTMTEADNALHTVRLGLNYAVGSGYEPLK